MGISFSCSGADYDVLDESFGADIVRSISFNSDDMKSTLRSVSFNGQDPEPTILKAFGSGKMIIEGSLSFKKREGDLFHLETKISIKSPSSEKENSIKSASFKSSKSSHLKEMARESPVLESGSPKHEAAVKLQKVYKSFRTRRQLADCAVLVEQHWWRLLDFALLKRSSISFFDIDKPESAVSRWARARTRAAKVGKGLSKDEKAQKLALQHWLEAIDPRHRYGHNLHFYYDSWLHCESRQPFFYWLDVGDGKEVNLERCPRSKLQQQCIKYLGPKEREAYEVVVEDGKFFCKQNRQLLDTSEGPRDSKWIFVLSTSKNLYVGQKKKGTFQHSSFLAGGATSAAGRLVVEKGLLKAVWPHSGHYRPTEENFQELVTYLEERNVDLTDVKKSPTEDDEESWSRIRSNSGLRSVSSELDLTKGNISCDEHETATETSDAYDGITSNITISKSISESKGKRFSSSTAEPKFGGDSKMKESFALDQNHVLPPKLGMLDDQDESEEETAESKSANSNERSESGDNEKMEESSISERHYRFRKRNLFVEEQEDDEEASVPQELILRRINSKKGMKSYDQLGKQLSFKWTTGAGPRIGCVRDYPSELQFRSLEQVNLSPRSAGNSRCYASPRSIITSPSPKSLETSSLKETVADRRDRVL